MKKTESAKCNCPFCETELVFSCFEPVFCKTCKIKLAICKKCDYFFNEKFLKCPECGEKNER